MRALFFVSLSAIVLSACSTTQENPIYQQTSTYQNGSTATQQYASGPVTQAAQTTTYTPETYSPETYSPETYSQDAYTTDAAYASHPTTTAYPVYAHPAPAPVIYEPATIAPTDTDYVAEQVTGTPGYIAMQSQSETAATGGQVTASPSVQTVSSSVYGPATAYGAAGTPIAYDYTRNLVTADALTTGQQPSETVRLLQGAGQSYTVQPGDTVYSLSRRTCVGVNVIQSMNSIGADYSIKIGQSLTLPASIC